MTERFQVDLAGIVDLLSRHLYSGPQVYLRELLQNAVDAVTARREADPDAPARVRLRVRPEGTDEVPGVPALDVTDTGIGLTLAEAAELLATIGRSSKRDPIGMGRDQYIGQFGIGMLAAFMVADRIEVVSRSVRPGEPPVRWRGRDDGTFDISAWPDAAAEVGTRVRIWAKRDAEHWLSPATVTALAKEYGSLLPVDVAVETPVAGAGLLPQRVSSPDLPWLKEYRDPGARQDALATWCEANFGFTPLGQIDLSVPLAGVTGVAFILPQAVSPGSGTHRVYLKRMLLGSRVDGLLPDWAFFVRTVVDATALNPTASREQLHADEVLIATREALGDQLKQWAKRTLTGDTPLAARFVQVHHLALRALALNDDAMLDLIATILPYETTDGPTTLARVARDGEVVYTTTVEDYRRVAAVARAQQVTIVNAGYVYDADLLGRLGTRPGWRVRELRVGDLAQVLAQLPPARELEILDALAAASRVLADADCAVLARSFEPSTSPAVLLQDREGAHQRELHREREAQDGVWGEVLAGFAVDEPSRQLVLNDSSPLVRKLLATPDGQVFAAGVRSLYLTAVMLSGDMLRSAELEDLNRALGTLLDAGLPSRDTSEEQR